jgi:hypothetical protein
MEKENKRTYNEICKRMEELRKNSGKKKPALKQTNYLLRLSHFSEQKGL